MKLSRRSYIVLCASMLAVAAPAYADSVDTLQKIKQAGKIRVATDLANSPFGMKDADLKPIGVDIDIAGQIAKDLGVELQIVPTTGPNRIPFLTTDKADIIVSTLAKRPEREEVIDYTQMPYSFSQSVVGAPKTMAISGWKDLAGKRIAVTRNTTNDTDVTKKAPDATVVRFDDEATTIAAVVTNQVDIIAQSPEFLDVINKRNTSKQMEAKFVVGQNEYGIGVRKGNPELKKWLNDWLVTNFDNGTLNRIHRKYLGYDLPKDFKTIWK